MTNLQTFRPSQARQIYYRITFACVAAVLFLFTTVDSLAFGPNGHRVVGRIAEHHLTPRAMQAIKEIMGPETLAYAATWPDEIRSDAKYDHTAPWHYVTIEDGAAYNPSAEDLKRGDVIEAIRRFTLQLKDPASSREDKIAAIKWLVHLVGDVHQPLHVGRGDDRGGNNIKVVWFGKDTNLHTVWDTGLIESTALSFSELAEFIDTAPPDKIREWQNSKVLDWATESVGYRERVYEVPDPSTGGSYKYAYKNLPLVEQRLAQAGIRLAGLLNSIFPGGPAADANVSDDTIGATLWVQAGLEYQAVTISAYRQGQRMLDQALTEKTWTALPEQEPKTPQEKAALAKLPPAVILDADETLLDNSPYQGWLIRQKTTFNPITWNRWVAAASAKAIPGAVDFIDYARNRGVAVFYVTNRDYRGDLDENGNGLIEPDEKDRILESYTLKNLRTVGLLPQKGISDEDSLLLRGERPDWGSDKTSRRRDLAKRYRIILLVGDSIGDFIGYDRGDRFVNYYDLDAAKRQEEMAKHKDRWAKSWIALPNSTYGGWLPGSRDKRLEALGAWDGNLKP